MAALKEITEMCRQGKVNEAYATAKQDLELQPQDVWKQRGMAWALYYSIKKSVAERNRDAVLEHIKEIIGLNMLDMANDAMIFDNVVWKIAEVIGSLSDNEVTVLDTIFQIIKPLRFNQSKGYSFLLKSVLRHGEWAQLLNFIEWWNLDSLMQEDYQQFQMENGRKLMSLAEQAYISYARILLRTHDAARINEFLPKIEKLTDDYPDMMYPGYFCGKLMMSMGAELQDTLKRVLPFVRKKVSEFWVWQLLSELYHEDTDMQTACLLRATKCNSKEVFLGKVRMKLASLYIKANDYNRARYHIDCITRCYLSQGWRLPYEVQDWIRMPWFQTSRADDTTNVDYMQMTDNILCTGANTCIAIVTYVDTVNKRASIVYGYKQRTMVRLGQIRKRVNEGTILEIAWMPVNGDRMNILRADYAEKSRIADVGHIHLLQGTVQKRNDKPFAFVRQNDKSYFVPPALVSRSRISDGDGVTGIAVFNYNNKKGEWTWSCVSIKKQ